MRRVRAFALLLFWLCTCALTAQETTSQRPDNTPPDGFIALWNGKDLTGWKGLVGNPKTRVAMSPAALAALQELADEDRNVHWSVAKGVLTFDGQGKNLCTVKEYGDFELYVDWKIGPGGNGGINLRGTPQVRIWDTALKDVGAEVGSGGLFNNKTHASKPQRKEDRPVGRWNTFFIKMVGDRVTVELNGRRVVDNVVMENFWEPGKPIYPRGQIELQCHGTKLWFKNIYLRQIKP